MLNMLLEAQKGEGAWGRVRALLGAGPSAGGEMEKDVVRRVAEMWVAGRGEVSGHVHAEVRAERVRAGLSAAVEDERCV